jgi:DNA-binding beta-propeller fold protein YncE
MFRFLLSGLIPASNFLGVSRAKQGDKTVSVIATASNTVTIEVTVGGSP